MSNLPMSATAAKKLENYARWIRGASERAVAAKAEADHYIAKSVAILASSGLTKQQAAEVLKKMVAGESVFEVEET